LEEGLVPNATSSRVQQVKETVLAVPAVYNLAMSLFGAERARTRLFKDFVRAKSGDAILDIGCGTGEVLDYLPQVDYLGIDIEPGYIEFAKKNYGERGDFICCRLEEFKSLNYPKKFDIAMAVGLLHHLTDEEALLALSVARDCLKPDGRLITVDGCFLRSGQSWAARKLVSMDRGEYVRELEHYRSLASNSFRRIHTHVLKDMLRIPFTHLVMELSP
jgi:SAM-dependent methyltransferase